MDCPGGYLIVPSLSAPHLYKTVSSVPCQITSPLWLQECCVEDKTLTLASTALLLWSAAGRRVWAGVPAPMQSEVPAYLPSWALQGVGSALEQPVPQCWEFRTGTPYGIARHAVWALCLQLPSRVLHCPSCPARCPWKHIQFGNKLMFQSRRVPSGPDYFQPFAYHLLSQGKTIRPLFKQILGYRLGSENIQILK